MLTRMTANSAVWMPDVIMENVRPPTVCGQTKREEPLVASASIRVGGVTLAAEEALRRATRYVTSPPGAYAYPSYDTYHTDSGPATLADGDLLAPLLLNAAPTIEAYESLRAHRQILERALAALPDRDLRDATDGDLTLISGLYRPLDPPGLAGVQGTTLSKVLHRKQPRLIPLYDRHTPVVLPGCARRPDRDRSPPPLG